MKKYFKWKISDLRSDVVWQSVAVPDGNAVGELGYKKRPTGERSDVEKIVGEAVLGGAYRRADSRYSNQPRLATKAAT